MFKNAYTQQREALLRKLKRAGSPNPAKTFPFVYGDENASDTQDARQEQINEMTKELEAQKQ